MVRDMWSAGQGMKPAILDHCAILILAGQFFQAIETRPV
jgi:hypothetical protein